MQKWCLILFSFISLSVKGQIIASTDSTGLYDPNGITIDTIGNLYVTTLLGNEIEKIDTNGLITIIAGTGSSGFSGDGGPATAAKLNQPNGIALDAIGNIFFADILNQRVRKIDVHTGTISTIAGIGPGGFGTGAFSGDGLQASVAALNAPSGVCFDNSGNLYISDMGNGRIRKISRSGIITTIIGIGYGYSGDGGPATASYCAPTYNIIFDNSGNIYFPQEGHGGNPHAVRKVNTLGIISTVAGDSTNNVYNGDNIPATSAYMNPGTLVFDSDGLLCISDVYNNRVRKIDINGTIHTIAGNGIGAHSGDGGLATNAEIYQPTGLAFNKCGNMYVTEVGSRAYIRRVSFNPYCLPTGEPEIVSKEIGIYPNPATDELHVDDVKAETNYVLVNITGIIEQQGTLQAGANTIDIKNLLCGLYLLELINGTGEKTVCKIIKK